MNVLQKRMILSFFLVIITNWMYNLSDGRYYFSRDNMPIVDLMIVVGAALTIIIQFYGTYLIVQKHIIKGE